MCGCRCRCEKTPTRAKPFTLSTDDRGSVYEAQFVSEQKHAAQKDAEARVFKARRDALRRTAPPHSPITQSARASTCPHDRVRRAAPTRRPRGCTGAEPCPRVSRQVHNPKVKQFVPTRSTKEPTLPEGFSLASDGQHERRAQYDAEVAARRAVRRLDPSLLPSSSAARRAWPAAC